MNSSPFSLWMCKVYLTFNECKVYLTLINWHASYFAIKLNCGYVQNLIWCNMIEQFFDQSSSSFTYLVSSSKHNACIIDPVKENNEIYIQYLDQHQLNLNFILETHTHAWVWVSRMKLRLSWCWSRYWM